MRARTPELLAHAHDIYAGMHGVRGDLGAPQNLPPDWRAAVDEETGQVYYLNDASKATQW